ncbi:MAG: cadherin-like domain-containing protein [Candidatus Marinimicrobia bacterium]|nr:cadherin-like domain-containing protein [Candidatus Neomarinimicrobiota bacterium]
MRNNRLTFEDLEPNMGVAPYFTYSPQDSVGNDSTLVWRLNEPLALSIPVGGTANNYQWMKDYIDIPGATSDSLSFTPIAYADSGSYGLRITNTIVTGLTLYSRPIHISVVDDQFPVAVNDSAEVLEDSSVTIRVLDNDSDPDGDALMISDVTVPVHGTAVIEPGDTSITYTPATNFFGPDTFSYVIDDGKGLLDIGVVFITVTPVNDPPGPFALLSPPTDTSLFVRAGFDTVVFSWQAARDPESELVTYFFKASSDYEGLFLADTTTDTTLALVPIFSYVLKSMRVDTFMVSWDITAFDGTDTTASINGFLDFTIIIDYPAATVLESLLPQAFALHQNYPNPFNPSTTIRFDLPVATEVHLAVYDLLGREVVRLVDGQLGAGHHQQVWDGRDRDGHAVPTGIYFVLVVTPEFRESIKIVLLK